MLRIRDCLSRIPDPDFYPSRILDPKTEMKDRGKKKIFVIPFFWSHKFHNIELFHFWNVEEKILDQFSKNYRTFYPKNCHQALKNMGLGSGIRDPGTGKNLFWIPDPGVKKATDTGSATLVPYVPILSLCVNSDPDPMAPKLLVLPEKILMKNNKSATQPCCYKNDLINLHVQ